MELSSQFWIFVVGIIFGILSSMFASAYIEYRKKILKRKPFNELIVFGFWLLIAIGLVAFVWFY